MTERGWVEYGCPKTTRSPLAKVNIVKTAAKTSNMCSVDYKWNVMHTTILVLHPPAIYGSESPFSPNRGCLYNFAIPPPLLVARLLPRGRHF